MKRIIITFLPIIIMAQTGWVKILGEKKTNEAAFCVYPAVDGGYTVLTGGPSCLVELDSKGNTIWTKTCSNTHITHIVPSNDSFYGYIGFWPLEVGKLDAQGDVVCAKTYYFDVYPQDISHTKDGGYIIVGDGHNEDHIDILVLAKIDKNCDTIWTRKYKPFSQDDAIHCGRIQETSDGGYIVAGYASPSSSLSSFPFLLKTDKSGNITWLQTYEIGAGAENVQQTRDGGYIVAGTTDYPFHVCFFKIDSKGNLLWDRTYAFGDCGNSFVAETNDGSFFFLYNGHKPGNENGIDQDFMLLKTDNNGDILWTRYYGGISHESTCGAALTADEGIIMCGSTMSFGTDRVGSNFDESDNIFIVKIDSLGRGIQLYIKPTRAYAPIELTNKNSINPKADFSNLSTDDYPYDLYCYCEIVGLDNHNSDYHDSVLIAGGLKGFDARKITFRTFTTKKIDNYKAFFYIKSPEGPSFPTDTMTVDFEYDPLEIGEEKPSETRSVFEMVASAGREIVLRYSEFPTGFHASVFDASGRKVDELHSTLAQGTITWRRCYGTGVYFIRVESATTPLVQKVVLVR